MVLAAALYVYDALLLLRPGEFVLARAGGGWQAAFGSLGWRLAGREPCVPNLAAPWQTLVRARWSLDDLETTAGTPPPVRAWRVDTTTQVAVSVLLWLIFGAFPVCLFVLSMPVVTLLVVAAIYATCLTTVLSLRRQWPALGLSPAAFRSLCFECLSCPPFCINAVRRVGLMQPTAWTLAEVRQALGAPAGAPPSAWPAALQTALHLRVLEQLDAEPDGSARIERLQRAAQALAPKDMS